MTESTNGAAVFTFSREFNASRDLVFRAWTEREHLARWWGPKGMTLGVITADVRPGGIFHYSMDNHGQLTYGRFLFREVVAPERLVYVSSFADAEGNVAPMPYLEVFPAEILNTVTFADAGNRTVVSLTGTPVNATPAEHAAFDGLGPSMESGFGGTFAKLDDYLATLR